MIVQRNVILSIGHQQLRQSLKMKAETTCFGRQMDVISGDYLEILQNIFSERKARNSRYSLRSFARDLELAPGTLSAILNGKRALTKEKAKELSNALKLPKSEETHFLNAVARAQEVRRSPTESGLKKIQEKFNFIRLRSDQLSFISDWYHLGLLNS